MDRATAPADSESELAKRPHRRDYSGEFNPPRTYSHLLRPKTPGGV